MIIDKAATRTLLSTTYETLFVPAQYFIDQFQLKCTCSEHNHKLISTQIHRSRLSLTVKHETD